MRRLAVIVAAFAVLALVPATAHAQTYFVPFVGADFGGSLGACASTNYTGRGCAVKRTTYGVTFGHLTGGIIGFEEDIGYAPDFFGTSTSFGSNSLLSLMSNLVIAIPAGPVRPYVTAGVGAIRTNVNISVASLLNFSNTKFGYDVGGGVMIFLPAHLGVRGDFRNIRSTGGLPFISTNTSKLSFSRFSVGLVLH